MDFGLGEKVVVVTGATANIGRAIALDFANEGVRLIAVGRDPDAGQRLVERALECGAASACFVAVDLRDPDAALHVRDQAADVGPVDVLVNGVGGNVDQGFFVDSDPAKWAGDIDLNFGTVLRMTHALLPQMIERGGGSVINLGSTAGLVGDYMLPVYSAMKGAVHSFTKVLAKEVGQHGIRVNAIAPYATFTTDPEGYSRGSRFHPDNIAFFTDFAASINEYDRGMRQRAPVLGKPYARADQVSALAVYLASERAGFVTGRIWEVEGGALL